tara:strand:- start:694 stop:1119 length:426 start_codon:yes stop_codon:yes gene_type:complete
MVALLSQCFKDDNITDADKFKQPEEKSDKQASLDASYPFPPQKDYPDLPKPRNSELLKKNDKILNSQLDDLSEYIEYLEKLVVNYRKSEEDRSKRIGDQTFNVVEGFSVGKNTNDLLIYIITCIFVLLLIDYIFKMGKNSY